jgi:predicted RNA-binding Zn ribbon-like protein
VPPSTPQDIPLWGGRLCLDLANTAVWDEGDELIVGGDEALRDAGELGVWGRRLGLVTAGAVPTAGDLAAVLGLRSAVHAVFAALTRQRDVAPAALAALTAAHAGATARATLQLEQGVGRWRWREDDARTIGDAVAVDAVELLIDAALLARVRRCPGPGCGWLFLDTSGRRRWCSMQVCGSRVKMRRLAERQHAR